MKYAAMIHSAGRHWLLMHERNKGEFNVTGWETEEQALISFEKMYSESAGVHGANSTAIGWLFFQPYIFSVEDDEALKRLVVAEPVLTKISNVAGRAMGVEVRPDLADAIVSRSVRPRLVT